MVFDKNASCVYQDGNKISMLSLSIPLFFESVFLLLYNTVNTLILSGYSQLAVSAVSVCGQISNIVVCIITMVIKGTVIITSVSLGSCNYKRAGKTCFNGMLFTIVLGAVFSAVLFFNSGTFCSLLNLEGKAKTIAVEYLSVYAMYFTVLCLYSYFNNLLICNGFSKFSMIIGVVSNILNALLSYFSLYGGIFNRISTIKRVAVSGFIAQFFGLVLCIIIFYLKKCPFCACFEFKTFLNIIKFGVPAGMTLLSFCISQTITTGFIVSLGLTVLNTKVYISNIISYISKGSLAVGNAGAVLIGRHKGSGNIEKISKLFSQNILIGVTLNLVISILCYIFYKELLSMFTKDTFIIESAKVIFAINIFLEISRAINHVGENALNANGDVKFTLTVSLISCWTFSVLFSYFMGIKLEFGLVGIWFAFLADEVFRGIMYLIRWKSGKWKEIIV